MKINRSAARAFVACVAVVGCASQIAWSDEIADLKRRVDALEKKGAASSLAGVSFSGYLDTSYTNNLNNPPSRLNAVRVFDSEANSFNLHALEIVMQKAAPDVGGAGFRADVFWGADANLFSPAGKVVGELDVKQAYIETKIAAIKGLSLKAGKYVTMAGAEVIEAKDNWQHSRSLLFGFSIPFSHLGARATYAPNDQGSLTVGLANGWDNNRDGNAVNGNKGKTFEGNLSVTPFKNASLALTGFYGPESTLAGNERSQRSLMDLVASFKPLEKLTLMGNWDYGSEQRASGIVAGQNAVWSGVAGYARWDFNGQWAASGRVERMSDLDGSRIMVGTRQKVAEWTLTGEFKPWSDLTTRLEYRQDTSSKAVFAQSDHMSRLQNTVAIEALYQF